MIFDFNFEQVMRVSNLKRWGIIEMSREQSVAEHSYNVALISAYIVDLLPNNMKPACLREAVVNWALVHDLPELVTGDIPTPLKKIIKVPVIEAEEDLFPLLKYHEDSISGLAKTICKAADLMDAIQFANKFCIDSRKHEIVDEMKEFLYSLADEMLEDEISFELDRVIRQICKEERTL